mmetsp:Transcript_12271/g.34793  ORF Transcript_12271/g.34793 Transcript_12271/m.34793 type:complete len:203 (+) Transcript_12271:256-864(+)
MPANNRQGSLWECSHHEKQPLVTKLIAPAKLDGSLSHNNSPTTYVLAGIEVVATGDIVFECPPTGHAPFHLSVRQQCGVQLRQDARAVQPDADEHHGAAAVTVHWVPRARRFHLLARRVEIVVAIATLAALWESRQPRRVDFQLHMPAGHVDVHRERVGGRHPQLPLHPNHAREDAGAGVAAAGRRVGVAAAVAVQQRLEPA